MIAIQSNEREKNNVAFRFAKARSFVERKATICRNYSSRVPKAALTLTLITTLFLPALCYASDLTGLIKTQDGDPIADAIVQIYTARPRIGPGVL